MKVLLDTHIWLWSLRNGERLGPKLRDILADPQTELWLSPISVWETVMLAEKGRIALQRPADEWVRDALAKAPVNEAPLTSEVALASRLIDLPHEDPADRFLVATARVYDLRLATADKHLLRTKSCLILPNR